MLIPDMHNIWGFYACCFLFGATIMLVHLERKSRLRWTLFGIMLGMMIQWLSYFLIG